MCRARVLRAFPCVLALCVLRAVLSAPAPAPAGLLPEPRARRDSADNRLDSAELSVISLPDLAVSGSEQRPASAGLQRAGDDDDSISLTSQEDNSAAASAVGPGTTPAPAPDPDPFDDDDDDDFEPMSTSSTGGGGSNIFSLLRLAGALFPGSGGGNAIIRNLIRDLVLGNQVPGLGSPLGYAPGGGLFLRRSDRGEDNEVDGVVGLEPPPPPQTLQRQRADDSESDTSESDTSESDTSESEESSSASDAEEDNAAEESVEDATDNEDSGSKSKVDSASVSQSQSESEEEPPGGGDGQGGGVLGLLAGLSGGEDGQSDLGSLLAAVSGIVVNLSGDGIDLNALIASGLGLFVGLLSEGEENPGSVVASYLLTSLDTLTGGGSKNNGAFFGSFLSKLIKGTSALVDPEASSEESGSGEPQKDSGGFLLSFLAGLLGDMSAGSSGGSKHWERAGAAAGADTHGGTHVTTS